MADTRMTLMELAERCEKAATGPDRELDGLIEVVRDPMRETILYNEPGPFPQKAVRGPVKDLALSGSDLADYVGAPRYTASLDAAMTLVPKGWRWIMREARPDKANANERGFFARLETRDFESVTWGKGSDWITDVVAGQDVHCWAATPALAICAASLRARAQ